MDEWKQAYVLKWMQPRWILNWSQSLKYVFVNNFIIFLKNTGIWVSHVFVINIWWLNSSVNKKLEFVAWVIKPICQINKSVLYQKMSDVATLLYTCAPGHVWDCIPSVVCWLSYIFWHLFLVVVYWKSDGKSSVFSHTKVFLFFLV